jgi:hypothetical protein
MMLPFLLLAMALDLKSIDIDAASCRDLRGLLRCVGNIKVVSGRYACWGSLLCSDQLLNWPFQGVGGDSCSRKLVLG